MKQPLLVLQGISRTFSSGSEKLRVLRNIDLTIYDGEMVAIVGPSGCGKTTLLNLLGCLDQATSGTYTVAEQNTVNLQSNQLAQLRAEYFGFIFQRYHLLNRLTAIENTEMPAVYLGMKKKEREQRAFGLLTQLGLKEKAHFLPRQLSGGQQQRVSIARALMNGGKIILADEPTGALDSKSGMEVMQIFRQLHQAHHTIILVTHDLGLASHADRIVELKDGAILKDTYCEHSSRDNQISHCSNEDTVVLRPQYVKYGYYFSDACKTAWRSILAHRMRSLLTMLGIIIGIASVVCVFALGDGVKEGIVNKFSDWGIKATYIRATRDDGTLAYPPNQLTLADASLVTSHPLVDSASPEIASEVFVHRGKVRRHGMVLGVGEQYYRVRDSGLATGKFFSHADILNHRKLALINPNTQKMLFKNENPIGKTIFIKGSPFQIIGITKKTKSAVQESDEVLVLAPYTTVMSRIIGSQNLTRIVFRVRDDVSIASAQSAVKRALINQHRQEDFLFSRPDEMIKMMQETIGSITLGISSIAVISLLVGGIGIMNIMLVSVTERKHEIGIRIAVGAKRKDISHQFLVEAILICLIGGLMGLLVAFIIGAIFNQLALEMRMSFSVASIILASTCSTLMGLLSGFWPARNAARLDPVITLSGN